MPSAVRTCRSYPIAFGEGSQHSDQSARHFIKPDESGSDVVLTEVVNPVTATSVVTAAEDWSATLR